MYDFISRAPAAIAPAAARPDDRPSFRRWTGWLMIALLAFALAACDSVEERAEKAAAAAEAAAEAEAAPAEEAAEEAPAE